MTSRDLRLDALRTLAIVLMVVYHAAYDLAVFRAWDIEVFSGGWKLLARTSLVLFLLVSGISQALSHRHKGASIRWKRVAQVAGAATLISIATYVMDPETYVRFGVLHVITVSALLLPFFARRGKWNALIGLMILAVAMVMPSLPIPHLSSLISIPLGFPPADFQTVDYVPLIPWFGVVLIGYGAGYLWRQTTSEHRVLTHLTWPGRHSLMIYLLHQPVLMTVLFVIYP